MTLPSNLAGLALPGYTFEKLDVAQAARVQALFDTDPDYFPNVELAPMRPDEGWQIFDELPANTPRDYKHVVVVSRSHAADSPGTAVALLDFSEHYPDATTWFLGLIFLDPRVRGAGLGTQLLDALCHTAKRAGAAALRLAVMHGNPDARRLYDRLGFQFVVTKDRTAWNGTKAPVDLLERRF